MPFHAAERTLQRLEWPELVARLAEETRTPQARARLEASPEALFAADVEAARRLLAETSEARGLLEEDRIPPFGGVREIGALLQRLRKQGLLLGPELMDLRTTLEAVCATVRYLTSHRARAPALAALGELLVGHDALVKEIDRALDPEGEVRDRASQALAAARREAREISGRAQQRIETMLREPEIRELLQDDYATVRNDRVVVPVRAELRGRLPGIVHDASSSGTTVFVEPQALVELNNRLKQAELTVARETRRVLRALSERAAAVAAEIEADLERVAWIDLAFARGQLALRLDASEPELVSEGGFVLPLLRHPLLPPEQVVPSDLRVGAPAPVLVISGPNAGGKTVAMKAVALTALMARAGMQVPCATGARVVAVDRVLADIGDEQDIHRSLSTFSAHMANLAEIVREAGPNTLVVLDEIGVGTDPGEGAALAQAVLEALAARGALVIATTHYNLLKELAEVDERFANASVEFDAETLVPTYRLKLGAPGSSSAATVAARMGMPRPVLERARALLEREDRQLDRMLSELSHHRVALERERSEAGRLRRESEAARDRYREKLEALQARRDRLFASMRAELEQAFRAAHAEVAGVIRDLQRKGSAQQAARARAQLLALEEEARQAETTQRARAPEPPSTSTSTPLDWERARPGDPVRVPGGRVGILHALPDRRGRATVQVGPARLQLLAEQLTAAAPGEAPVARTTHVRTSPPPVDAGARLDLRGLRVDEALARLERALDDAARRGAARLEILHGVGTGALQTAVREHLATLPYVERIEPGDPEAGHAGTTYAHLEG